MKFKVIEGEHSQFGETYKKGDVIDTPYNLAEMFPNKFERLPDPAPAVKPEPPPPTPPTPPAPPTPPTLKATPKKGK